MTRQLKRTERIGLVLDEGMRQKIEVEARRRSTSMSSIVRALVIAQLAEKQSENRQAAA